MFTIRDWPEAHQSPSLDTHKKKQKELCSIWLAWSLYLMSSTAKNLDRKSSVNKKTGIWIRFQLDFEYLQKPTKKSFHDFTPIFIGCAWGGASMLVAFLAARASIRSHILWRRQHQSFSLVRSKTVERSRKEEEKRALLWESQKKFRSKIYRSSSKGLSTNFSYWEHNGLKLMFSLDFVRLFFQTCPELYWENFQDFLKESLKHF